MSCAEFTDQAVELALGTLEGHARADALRHADGCPTCRALLQDLSFTADALWELAPSAEPPIGFESRVFERMRSPRATSTPRRWRRLAAAAGIAVIALGVGFGAARLTGDSHTEGSGPIAVATLVTDGVPHGQIVVGPGNPPWMIVAVADLDGVASVGCDVTLADGRVVHVGTFQLAKGYGSWTVPLTVSPAELRTAELRRPDGTSIVTAKFAS